VRSRSISSMVQRQTSFNLTQAINALISGQRIREQMARPDKPGSLRRSSEPPAACGRNEACPCGSGKKYKRCCRGKEIKPRAQEAKHADPGQETALDRRVG